MPVIPAAPLQFREVVVNDHRFPVSRLGNTMDAAFDTLYEQFVARQPVDWARFHAAALAFFDAAIGRPDAHDAYFTSFTPLWTGILATNNYLAAEQFWQQALAPAWAWEESHPGLWIHKGTPYYFWAMTCLIHDDVDNGYVLMHKGVEEDVRTNNPQEARNRPGYYLVSLDAHQERQAFRVWVTTQAEFFNDLLQSYRTTYQATLGVDDVRQRFLLTFPENETPFLLTYTAARLRNLAILPSHATRNAFAGQVELNILFDVATVIDVAIKAHSHNLTGTFIDQAEYLLGTIGHRLTINQLRQINKQFIRDFDQTMQRALDGRIVLRDGTVLNRYQSDVALAYGIRNRGGHQTSAAPTIWTRFHDVRDAMFRVLGMTIDTLYP